jgi:recombination DNA repair RAD52 pathway protein
MESLTKNYTYDIDKAYVELEIERMNNAKKIRDMDNTIREMDNAIREKDNTIMLERLEKVKLRTEIDSLRRETLELRSKINDKSNGKSQSKSI